MLQFQRNVEAEDLIAFRRDQTAHMSTSGYSSAGWAMIYLIARRLGLRNRRVQSARHVVLAAEPSAGDRFLIIRDSMNMSSWVIPQRKPGVESLRDLLDYQPVVTSAPEYFADQAKELDSVLCDFTDDDAVLRLEGVLQNSESRHISRYRRLPYRTDSFDYGNRTHVAQLELMLEEHIKYTSNLDTVDFENEMRFFVNPDFAREFAHAWPMHAVCVFDHDKLIGFNIAFGSAHGLWVGFFTLRNRSYPHLHEYLNCELSRRLYYQHGATFLSTLAMGTTSRLGIASYKTDKVRASFGYTVPLFMVQTKPAKLRINYRLSDRQDTVTIVQNTSYCDMVKEIQDSGIRPIEDHRRVVTHKGVIYDGLEMHHEVEVIKC